MNTSPEIKINSAPFAIEDFVKLRPRLFTVQSTRGPQRMRTFCNIDWQVPCRREAAVDYNAVLQGRRVHEAVARQVVDRLFTGEEAVALAVYLKRRGYDDLKISEVFLPVRIGVDDEHYSYASKPFIDLSLDPDYDLPIRIIGRYQEGFQKHLLPPVSIVRLEGKKPFRAICCISGEPFNVNPACAYVLKSDHFRFVRDAVAQLCPIENSVSGLPVVQ